jgi:serine/threonine-protein kinase
MIAATLPTDEPERLRKLQSTGLIDSEREAPFENAVKLACLICNAPIALVSLVAEDRQWFKARVGIEAIQTGRDEAFCAHAITMDEPLVVQDARSDPRFFDNPLVVRDPTIRFYAGVPLRILGGSAIGTLCVIDRVPRELSPQQLEGLSILARQIELEIESRRNSVRRSSLPAPSEVQLAAPSNRSLAATVAAEAARSSNSACDTLTALPGEMVGGRYLVGEFIDRGGMGIVMKATDLVGGGTVALKILHSSVTSERLGLDRFTREARLLRTLRTEHIPRIVDVGNLPSGLPFIAMEYVSGTLLETLIDERGKLEPALALEILRQAAKGVALAHANGIVHRDLKPSNLMLVPNGSGFLVKILDFGVAKGPVEGDLLTTMQHALIGTVHYMSPEQVVGAPTLDARSDVWSLGCIGYEMLTGELAFDGDSAMQVLSRVLIEDATPIADLVPSVPCDIAAIVTRCIARDPNDRYPDANALMIALGP